MSQQQECPSREVVVPPSPTKYFRRLWNFQVQNEASLKVLGIWPLIVNTWDGLLCIWRHSLIPSTGTEVSLRASPQLVVFLSYLCCSADRGQIYSGPDLCPFFPNIYAVPHSSRWGPAHVGQAVGIPVLLLFQCMNLRCDNLLSSTYQELRGVKVIALNWLYVGCFSV